MSINDLIYGTEQVQKPCGPRVLLVDDEEVQRELMGIGLESAGFEVDEAADGYEALEKLKQFHYDAIVLDFNMPGMNGSEVCSTLRKTPEGKNLSIIGTSALSHNKQYFQDADADVFLDKREITDFPYVLEKNINAAVAYRRGI